VSGLVLKCCGRTFRPRRKWNGVVECLWVHAAILIGLATLSARHAHARAHMYTHTHHTHNLICDKHLQYTWYTHTHTQLDGPTQESMPSTPGPLLGVQLGRPKLRLSLFYITSISIKNRMDTQGSTRIDAECHIYIAVSVSGALYRQSTN